MHNFTKTVRLGTVEIDSRPAGVYCKIKFTEGDLSISGVEGPTRDGNCRGSCGQIDMHLRDAQKTIALAPNWTRAMLAEFFEAWRDWHLNDMKAGDAVQEAWLKANPIPPADYAYPKSHYEVASAALTAAGLNPHDGYAYGHAWKRQEVPESVLAFLQGLPDTDIVPAWV